MGFLTLIITVSVTLVSIYLSPSSRTMSISSLLNFCFRVIFFTYRTSYTTTNVSRVLKKKKKQLNKLKRKRGDRQLNRRKKELRQFRTLSFVVSVKLIESTSQTNFSSVRLYCTRGDVTVVDKVSDMTFLFPPNSNLIFIVLSMFET